MPRTTKAHLIPTKVENLRVGDTIVHPDGSHQVIARIGHHRDEHGFATDLSFEGEGVIPFAVRDRLGETFRKVVPFPKAGDRATKVVGSDAYPLKVVACSPSGAKLRLLPLKARVVSGSFQSGDAEVEITDPGSGDLIIANWSEKRGRYLYGGAPVVVGHARYYQDPSF